MRPLVLAVCLISGTVSAQTARLDCSRAPAYTAQLEQLLATTKPDPSIWRMPAGDAVSTIGSRIIGKGDERAQQQREQYEQYVSRIKTIMWSVREKCPGS